MGLEVDPPDPPDLTNRPSKTGPEAEEADETEDLRRAELEAALGDGAWTEAFREWAEYTDLTEAEYEGLRAAAVFERFDFYWDSAAATVRFEVASLPDAVARESDLAARATASLTDLGETVVKLLEAEYLDWGEADAGERDWSEETVGSESPIED